MNRHPLPPDKVQQWVYNNIASAQTEAHIETCRHIAEVATTYIKSYEMLSAQEVAVFSQQLHGAINFKLNTL